MIVENTYNKRKKTFHRIYDIHEDYVRPDRLNATKLEKHLMKINKGSKRRIKNNHAVRLARFKAQN